MCAHHVSHNTKWRHFGAKYVDMHTDYTGQGVDQLAQVIDLIKHQPDSRRIIMSAWNCTGKAGPHSTSTARGRPFSPFTLFCSFCIFGEHSAGCACVRWVSTGCKTRGGTRFVCTWFTHTLSLYSTCFYASPRNKSWPYRHSPDGLAALPHHVSVLRLQWRAFLPAVSAFCRHGEYRYHYGGLSCQPPGTYVCGVVR